MSKAEAGAALLIVAIGGAMFYEAAKMPYFVEGVPGPGFMPRWIAGALLLVGAILVFQALRPRAGLAASIAWPAPSGRIRVATVLGALAVSLTVLDKLGFLVTTTSFMAVVIYGLGVRSWRTLAIVPILAAVILYGVFSLWLGVPLPKGILSDLG